MGAAGRNEQCGCGSGRTRPSLPEVPAQDNHRQSHNEVRAADLTKRIFAPDTQFDPRWLGRTLLHVDLGGWAYLSMVIDLMSLNGVGASR